MARFQLMSLGIGVAVDEHGAVAGNRVFTLTGGPLYAGSTGLGLTQQTNMITDRDGRAPGWLDPDTDPGAYTIDYGTGVPVTFLVGGGSAIAVRVTSSGTLVPSATATALSWVTEVYDTNNMFDPTAPTRLTVQKAGRYRIYGTICYDISTAGERAIAFRLNGNNATYAGGERGVEDGLGAATTCVSASTTVLLAAGDYVECIAYQVSTGSLAVGFGTPPIQIPTHFGMEKID